MESSKLLSSARMSRKIMRQLVAMVLLSTVIAVLGLGQALTIHRLSQDLNARVAILERRVAEQETRLTELRQGVLGLEETLGLILRELERWQVVEMWATAYAPFDNRSGICNDGNPWSTATGTVPGPGTIAVNPEVIPYGARLFVEGYGWGVAEDTGSAIRARTDLIDLMFYCYEEAVNWGRRQVKVFIRTGT